MCVCVTDYGILILPRIIRVLERAQHDLQGFRRVKDSWETNVKWDPLAWSPDTLWTRRIPALHVPMVRLGPSLFTQQAGFPRLPCVELRARRRACSSEQGGRRVPSWVRDCYTPPPPGLPKKRNFSRFPFQPPYGHHHRGHEPPGGDPGRQLPDQPDSKCGVPHA